MDRQIPRGLDSKIIHVDSAFRRSDESVNKYKIFFDSFDKKRAKIVKDVVGLRINKATIPKVHNNIIPGKNILNLHVTQTSSPVTKTLYSKSDLDQYIRNLSFNFLVLTASDTKGGYEISSKNGNQLLISSSNFPNSTFLETHHVLLVTSEKKIWIKETDFPITLSLSIAESHRLLLKPGYYPTTSMIIGELFETFATIDSDRNHDLQYYYDWNATNTTDAEGNITQDTNGWSVYKEARGRWTLYFRTLDDKDDLQIFFSREPGEYDVLHQLGLRSAQSTNWAIPTPPDKSNTRLFQMKKHTFSPPTTSNVSNTIIGRSDLNFSSIFELQFEQINLSPRRYVDIQINNIPNSSLITNNMIHNEVFARIDLCEQNISYSASIETTTRSNIQKEFDESSSSDTYVVFENNTNKMPLFDPISLDHLEIEIVDNFGFPYIAETRSYFTDRNDSAW